MTVHEFSEVVFLVFSFGLSWFCFSLSRKVKGLNSLESGLGGAIAVMISEVDRLERAVMDAKAEAVEAKSSLAEEIARAKQERSLWSMRQNFVNSSEKDRKILIRRRQSRRESANEI